MSSSTTIQVSHANDGSLRINFTIHNANGQSHLLTMQQGGVQQQYQIQQQPQPLQLQPQLPLNDVCNEIFDKILDTVCLDVDINGNAANKSNNRMLNSPIDNWAFSNQQLANYTGLTVLQILVLQPPIWYGRLQKLIASGASTRCCIGPTANQIYRPFNEACYLAARFSTDPLSCLKILGMSCMQIGPNQDWRMAFDWDRSCEASDCCARILLSRQDLSSKQLAEISNLSFRLPVLKAEEIEHVAPGGQLDDFNWPFFLEEFTQ